MERSMTETESSITAVFMDAGWKPNWRAPDDPSRLVFHQDCGASGWNVGGLDPIDGTMRWANTAIDPATPSDPVERARLLVAQYAVAPVTDPERTAIAEVEQMFDPGPQQEETPQDEQRDPVSEVESAPAMAGSEAVGGEGFAGEADAADDARLGDGDAEFVPEPDITDADFTDADFTEAFGEPEALEAEAAAEPLALEGADLPDEIFEHEDAASYGPGAFIFGDNIHTIRLAKMGRLSQRARELKGELQDGWTLDEYRSLQNLIVRIDRGEAPDDAEQRARFLAINERSAAMARVDAYRELREAELEAADREGVEAFDPEAGWPG